MSAIRCLLADDHPAILAAVGAFLHEAGFNVVGEARTGAQTLSLIAREQPDVVLLDVRLPDANGVDVARQIAVSHPETRVVLYTAVGDRGLVTEAFDAGVRGIVVKDAPIADLTRALTVVAAGSTYVDPTLAGALGARAAASAHNLTKREREVLRLLTEGCTLQEIGARIHLSPETVRTHVRKAIKRLGARTRTQAVAMAMREGLIS